ncbi:acyl-CoA synthetase (AMP-forming)/AMP-acid ligase II [Mycobacteroides abscessus subsp. abscessus]|nr:acyl-CoA synthetase (AMP-forming)/AMP-acid ligase II [Mycobacteroides abscessus subsp. abscessus]
MVATSPRPTVGPGEIIECAAARHPDKTALVVGSDRLTYRELNHRCRALAAALQLRGIGPGDVVTIYGQNSWQWIVAYHSILRAGAVANPVNVMLTAPELAYVLDDCDAKALFADAERAEAAAAAVPSARSLRVFAGLGDDQIPSATSFSALLRDGGALEPRPAMHAPRDLCSIAYTSGTTGHPKGAMQSHESVLLNCALTATMHGRSENDVVVTALPAAHVYGNVAINSTFLAGGTVVLMGRFDAGRALSLIETEGATMFEGVPAMYSMLLADPALERTAFSSLRLSTVGGQTLSTEVLTAWQSHTGAPLIELWGMTELAGLGSTHSVYAPPRPGSIGVSLPGIELGLAPIDGATGHVPTGCHGELAVRGPLVMLGYHKRPDATAEVLSEDGWLRTGDIAYADNTGHYFVVDRIKDMIITGGYNVYPAEIERVVATHPDVVMVAVGPRHDPVRGEIAVAYVVPKPGSRPSEEDVIGHCRNQLAAYKCPRAVVLVDVLPTTSSGKVMRRKLAELDPVVQKQDSQHVNFCATPAGSNGIG